MPRPKSFDPEAVLCKAMRVFWEKGYDAASISDLTEAMGINRFSLYDTFGDKHSLYIKALDSYHQRFVGPIIDKINAIDTISGLEAYFNGVIDFIQGNTGKPCCMMQKAAVSAPGIDEEACTRVKQSRAKFQEAFEGVFARLRDASQLGEHIDPKTAACLAVTIQSGLLSFNAPPITADDARAAIRILIRSLGSVSIPVAG